MAKRPPLYPGNSNSERVKEEMEERKAAQIVPAEPSAEEKPEIQKKELAGSVVKRKKSLSESFAAVFFGETAKKVVDYVWFDVVIPTAKDTLDDIIKNAAHMMIYGESGRRDSGIRRDGERTTVIRRSYDRFYDERDRERNRDRDRRNDRDDGRLRSRYNFDEIVFTNRGDAEYVLGRLVDMIDQYDTVSVSEFFDAARLEYTHVDENYGWESLGGAAVVPYRGRGGGYVLELPKPIILR